MIVHEDFHISGSIIFIRGRGVKALIKKFTNWLFNEPKGEREARCDVIYFDIEREQHMVASMRFRGFWIRKSSLVAIPIRYYFEQNRGRILCIARPDVKLRKIDNNRFNVKITSEIGKFRHDSLGLFSKLNQPFKLITDPDKYFSWKYWAIRFKSEWGFDIDGDCPYDAMLQVGKILKQSWRRG